MFRPELGVSLHTVVMPLRAEHENLLLGTQIKTLEVLPTSLFGPDSLEKGAGILARMLEISGVRAATVHCPFGGGIDISSLDDAVSRAGLDVLDRCLDLAEAFAVPMLVVHASAEPISDDARPDRLRRARSSLSSIAGRCRKANIRVAVELLPRTCLGNTVEELNRLLADLPSDLFGVCLDVNHLMDRYAELPGAVRDLGDRLLTLHLSDYDGVDEKHWMPGEGVIDWRGFLSALQDIGYAGPFNYEAKPHGDTPIEKIRNLESNFKMLTELLAG